MALNTLAEVDSMEILIVVNDEIDQISHSPNQAVKQVGSFAGVRLAPLDPAEPRSGAAAELKMNHICCGAFGFSAVITVTQGSKKHVLLFDTGPEEEVWERNATRLGLDAGAIEHIHLSHWHRDHSGGILKAISMINAQKAPSQPKVVVDVHPDRPEFRGVKTPGGQIVSLEPDPTFDDIEAVGGVMSKNDQIHRVLSDNFLISGAIPRVTEYETGIAGGMRYDTTSNEWVSDGLIMDERLVLCNIKGKGLVVFTGCSHAGVVNVAKHAKQLGGNIPLYCIVGGYHLADASEEKLRKSMDDLRALGPEILMPGHCTGWKFKFMINQEMPTRMVPCFGGSRYSL